METENLKIFYKILGIIVNISENKTIPNSFKVTSNVTGAFFNFKIACAGMDFIDDNIKNVLNEKFHNIFYNYEIKCSTGKVFSELNVSIPLM